MALADLRRARGPAALLAIAILAGCGTPSPGPVSPTPSGDPSAASSTSAATSDSASTSAEPVATADPATSASASAPPPKPGVPAGDSTPPGVSPLSDAEKKELSTKCKKLADAITAVARKDGGKKRPVDYVETVLANPPKLPGVDVPRCSDLLRRDTVAYLARSRESEATINLKRIVVGLVTALEREPPVFCGSAPPVPATVDALKDKPYASTVQDWKTDGWKCVAFDLTGGMQVFQYELRTDAKNKTFEATARGYPVQGAAPTELYIAGKVQNGAIDPSMPVMRR